MGVAQDTSMLTFKCCCPGNLVIKPTIKQKQKKEKEKKAESTLNLQKIFWDTKTPNIAWLHFGRLHDVGVT